MSKQLISITDITGYLYCPRKFWLKMQGVREPLNKKMILGMIKHKIFDVFNKQDYLIIASISQVLSKKELSSLYETDLIKIIDEICNQNEKMMESFSILKKEVLESMLKLTKREIELRVESILKVLSRNIFGKELWRNLSPKYLTEVSIVNPELGLKGRVDRVQLDNNIIPYEIKTREEIYESDRIQLAGYALLLEKEFNKPVNFGIVEVENKQEEIILDEKLKARVLELAEEIRNLKEPKFLNNFSKCEKCSLRDECFN